MSDLDIYILNVLVNINHIYYLIVLYSIEFIIYNIITFCKIKF